MNEVSVFIDDIEKRLSREIKDLEDIRLVMIAIKDLRENEKFYTDYEQGGPTLTGLTPRESSDRQILFQSRVENLYKTYETYHGGELLFGIPITDFPQLEKIKKDLTLLQRLYGLYNKVS